MIKILHSIILSEANGAGVMCPNTSQRHDVPLKIAFIDLLPTSVYVLHDSMGGG